MPMAAAIVTIANVVMAAVVEPHRVVAVAVAVAVEPQQSWA